MAAASLPETLAAAAVAAADPRKTTREALARAGIEGPVTLFSFGKAALGMARAALESVAVERGIVIAPQARPIDPRILVLRGDHPLPGPETARHGAAVLALARAMRPNEHALVLVSGGGSAMLERPVAGVGMDEIAASSRALMLAGADIAELNAVRRCLSEFKGGGLARAIGAGRITCVVLSDVPGRPPSLVASGPCARHDAWPDPRDVVARYGLRERLPASVLAAIERRAGEPVDAASLARVQTLLAASNDDAVAAVRKEAARRGLTLAVSPDPITGNAGTAALRFVTQARAAAAQGAHGLVGGGETTVTVRGPGRGGRNQEAALAVLAAGADLLGDGMFLAIATDGVDGTSDAAGAWVEPAHLARVAPSEVRRCLEHNDSHALFAALGSQIRTGPTGTNVADVWAWIGPRAWRTEPGACEVER